MRMVGGVDGEQGEGLRVTLSINLSTVLVLPTLQDQQFSYHSPAHGHQAINIASTIYYHYMQRAYI